MALICAAESCKAQYEGDTCNLVFFPFPEDEETCRAWVLRSGRHDLLNRTVEEIHLTEFLCERHFEDHCMDKTGPIALKPKAKPTLFDHDMSQFAHEIAQEKTIGDVMSPDIVVIPCVIMDSGVNTEVIGFNGENVKEETIDRNDIEQQLQLMEEGAYMDTNVLTEDDKRIDVEQHVGNLHADITESSVIAPDTLVVDSIHSVESSEWQDSSLSTLANQICRVCANENLEMIPLFGDQSIQLQILNKIQWHLPIVADDKRSVEIEVSSKTSDSQLSGKNIHIHGIKEIPIKDVIETILPEANRENSSMRNGEINTFSANASLENTTIKSEETGDKYYVESPDKVTDTNIEILDENECSTEKSNLHVHEPMESENYRNQVVSEEVLSNREIETEEDKLDGNEKDRSSELRCNICGFLARNKKNLLQHMSRKHVALQFRCNYCDKLFSNEPARRLHERSHTSAIKEVEPTCFVCEYCGRSFRSKKTLKEHHLAVHSDEKPYKCDKCDRNYGSLSSLDIHKATHSTETPFLCDLCGKTFKHVSNLRSHKRSHLEDSDKNRQICNKCGKGFRSRFHLSEHMNVHNGVKPYSCEVCGKYFHKKIQLRQHGSAHSGTQPYKCHICGVKFNRRGNMTQHIKRHNQERKYTCRVCNESFPTLGAVLNHRKKHSDLEVQRSMTQSTDDADLAAFKCEVCGKLLAKKESLVIHMRSHTGEKLFQCPECGKQLSNKGSLTYHIRSFHTGERPYTCQFCGDGFLSKEARLVHERIHTGEKPYECLVCGMAFRCSSNLAQHSRVHSDARPHPCLTCGKKFQRKGALDVHMRTHTGERPYACDICGRAFTQKNDMLKHRRTHTNEKPFRCETCGHIFSQKRDLTKHRMSHNTEHTNDAESEIPTQTVVITTSDNLLTAFPEINVPVMEHTQTVILHRF